MASRKVQDLIHEGRDFIRFDESHLVEPSDQEKKLHQPPLTKTKMADQSIDLPHDFELLPIKKDFLAIINERESHRIYTEEPMSLLELSYLLWTTQGVKSIRGKNYATMRTVPSGGARHPFETYLLVRKVTGLVPGAYHYLPLTHKIEFLGEVEEMDTLIIDALDRQRWAASANVLFFWSIVPYRGEWRYSEFAHRIMLVDIGYVSQNLYLACESIGLGTCAIGAFHVHDCDHLFNLDGIDEFTILVSPVGTISKKKNQEKEQAFYAFLKEEE
ncbi:MAG: SagB/ThcOx family dehydrogenase [Candidatus Izemoplasmatales bacterium]|nr:SagB/ThcOx family dehydrogenase [Candidatus Izemoplasmatales bacterium]